MIKDKNKEGGLMKSQLFIVLFLFLLISPMAQAIGYNKTCVGEDTLKTNIVREVCDEDGCFNITVEETNVCQYGCREEDGLAKCEESPMMKNLVVGGVIIVVIFLIYVLWVKL